MAQKLSESLQQRELEVAREIAHAFLTANTPVEVYRLALARVMPLVHASFASVFLRDSGDPDLLRLVCAHNWPQSAAPFLSRMRIRVGRGPTGRAVAEGVAIETNDIFADPGLREWWEPARELGFASLIALPLRTVNRTAGALSFYFDNPRTVEGEERDLLALIADQLAATAEKAHRMEDLREANRGLEAKNVELIRRIDEAEAARRLKTEFLANMGHELRTPLTAILGYAELLTSGSGGELSERQTKALERIEHSSHVLLGLITDLLALSELKLGRTRPSLSEERALDLAERAVEAAGPVPEDIEFSIDPPATALTLETDSDKAVKILENLVSNAFKFTSTGTVNVRIRASSAAGNARQVSAGMVEWLIEDSGIGIEPEELDAIFDEFRQVDGSSTRLYGGTGLGLALSRELARLLGGYISVESEPGRGSVFTLGLPMRSPPGTFASKRVARAATSHSM